MPVSLECVSILNVLRLGSTCFVDGCSEKTSEIEVGGLIRRKKGCGLLMLMCMFIRHHVVRALSRNSNAFIEESGTTLGESKATSTSSSLSTRSRSSRSLSPRPSQEKEKERRERERKDRELPPLETTGPSRYYRQHTAMSTRTSVRPRFVLWFNGSVSIYTTSSITVSIILPAANTLLLAQCNISLAYLYTASTSGQLDIPTIWAKQST